MLVSSANRIISAVGSSSVKMSVEIKLHSARLLSLGYFKLKVMLKEEEGRRKEDTAVAVIVMMTGAHSVFASFCRDTETNNWTFVAQRPISADTTSHCVK